MFFIFLLPYSKYGGFMKRKCFILYPVDKEGIWYSKWNQSQYESSKEEIIKKDLVYKEYDGFKEIISKNGIKISYISNGGWSGYSQIEIEAPDRYKAIGFIKKYRKEIEDYLLPCDAKLPERIEFS